VNFGRNVAERAESCTSLKLISVEYNDMQGDTSDDTLRNTRACRKIDPQIGLNIIFLGYAIPRECLNCDTSTMCSIGSPSLTHGCCSPSSLDRYFVLQTMLLTLGHHQNHGVAADCNPGMLIQLSADDSRDALTWFAGYLSA
jgi:hypothetical protein